MTVPALTAIAGARAFNLAQLSSVSNSAASAAPSFEATLLQLGTEAAKTVHEGEAAALAGAMGTISVQQVVDSVMAAERTLNTAIALRDKTVQAYRDVINMTI